MYVLGASLGTQRQFIYTSFLVAEASPRVVSRGSYNSQFRAEEPICKLSHIPSP